MAKASWKEVLLCPLTPTVSPQGCGFGYRYTRLPHLLKTKPEDANLPSLQSEYPGWTGPGDSSRQADSPFLLETLSSKPISWTCSRLLTLFLVFHFSYSLGKMRARLGQVLLFSISL